MGNRNYSRMSSKPYVEKKSEPKEEPKIELEKTSLAEVKEEPKVETKIPEVKKKVFGTVVNCARLNVRADCSSEAPVIVQIPAGEKVEILEELSDFYRVVTVGKNGFCVKPYISVQ